MWYFLIECIKIPVPNQWKCKTWDMIINFTLKSASSGRFQKLCLLSKTSFCESPRFYCVWGVRNQYNCYSDVPTIFSMNHIIIIFIQFLVIRIMVGVTRESQLNEKKNQNNLRSCALRKQSIELLSIRFMSNSYRLFINVYCAIISRPILDSLIAFEYVILWGVLNIITIPFIVRHDKSDIIHLFHVHKHQFVMSVYRKSKNSAYINWLKRHK